MKNASPDEGLAPVSSSEVDTRSNSAPAPSPTTHHRKSDRSREPRTPPLAAAITIAEWKKNRRGESIKVQITPFEGANLINIRTWYGEDGYRKPGRGLSATVNHLGALAAALNKALAKAIELNLIDGEGAE
jgi:hypothetical protein